MNVQPAQHVYLYFLRIAKKVWWEQTNKLCVRPYVLNTFSAFSKLLVFSTWDKGGENYICGFQSESRRILSNTGPVDQFSQLPINLCKNAWERSQIFSICLFLENTRMCGASFRILFYSSKWSWKIVDYEYRPQTPYLDIKSEIFLHLWDETFSYGKSSTKKTCLLFDGTIHTLSIFKLALWCHYNMVYYWWINFIVQ